VRLGLVSDCAMALPDPGEAPVIPPVIVPIVQTKVLGTEEVRFIFVFVPVQTLAAEGVVTTGAGFTVIVADLKQDVAVNVYLISAVPPDAPVTNPPASTDATAGFILDHDPPGVISLRSVVRPSHTVVVPVIAAGSGLTVIVAEGDVKPADREQ